MKGSQGKKPQARRRRGRPDRRAGTKGLPSIPGAFASGYPPHSPRTRGGESRDADTPQGNDDPPHRRPRHPASRAVRIVFAVRRWRYRRQTPRRRTPSLQRASTRRPRPPSCRHRLPRASSATTPPPNTPDLVAERAIVADPSRTALPAEQAGDGGKGSPKGVGKRGNQSPDACAGASHELRHRAAPHRASPVHDTNHSRRKSDERTP